MNDVRAQVALPFSMESIWAILPSAYENMRETLSSMPTDRLAAVASGPVSHKDAQSYQVHGSVAVIPFSGVVSKRQTLMGRIFGGQAVTTEFRAALRAAGADPEVKSILAKFDSPGGSVDGTADAAADFAACEKPTVAYIEDLGASAAYWIASQADRVVANSTAVVGSIGIFATVQDTSRAAKNLGVDIQVVGSAPGKGAGTPGAPVTSTQVADMQARVDALAEEFVGAVSRGRGFDATALADGRVHVGKAALEVGLVDAIDSLDSVIAGMQVKTEEAPMPQEPVVVVPPTTPPAAIVTPPPVVVAVDYSADIAAMKAKIAAMESDKDIEAALAKGVADRKLTPALLKTARTIAKNGGFATLTEFLAELPAAAPDGGSVMDTDVTDTSASEARHPADHVGGSLHAFKKENGPVHQAAIAYMERAEKAGRPVDYRAAVVAISHK